MTFNMSLAEESDKQQLRSPSNKSLEPLSPDLPILITRAYGAEP